MQNNGIQDEENTQPNEDSIDKQNEKGIETDI